jgi:TPP-dependent pyruvate/acetoin dehydrogenase alpha subunit
MVAEREGLRVRADITSDKLVPALGMMFLIRAFEQKVAELYARGEITGLLHLGIGQEAIAAGAAVHLRRDDVVFPGHRGHGHALGKGADPERLLAELAGRENGYCAGRGGSMHIAAPDVGFITATGIVAQNVPLAIGAAWALQLDRSDGVAVAFFGDGAAQAGALHESLNLSSLWQLPVVFVCENNGFAEFTPLSAHTRVQRLTAHASVYDIPVATIDGNDLGAVLHAVGTAVARARSGGGPSFIEAITYRLRGHYEGDAAKYRDPTEVARWREKDPIPRAVRAAVRRGLLDHGEAVALERHQWSLVEHAASDALSAPLADPAGVLRGVYA